MRFELLNEPMDGLKLLSRGQIGDPRGHFSRLFCADALSEHGWNNCVVQSNFSHTAEVGTVRGLHFQHPPHAEDKLVTCVAGAVFDVAVDLRERSPSFGKWFGAELSAENAHSLLIPKGFAHGFQVIKPNSSMVYFHSATYQPEFESGIAHNDPMLAISWPLQPIGLSQRDKQLSYFDTLEGGLNI